MIAIAAEDITSAMPLLEYVQLICDNRGLFPALPTTGSTSYYTNIYYTAPTTFFNLSLSFFFTFFSLFLLVRFSRSAASLSPAITATAAFFAFSIADHLRRIIRLFLPALLFPDEPSAEIFEDLVACNCENLMVMTRHGNPNPGWNERLAKSRGPMDDNRPYPVMKLRGFDSFTRER